MNQLKRWIYRGSFSAGILLTEYEILQRLGRSFVVFAVVCALAYSRHTLPRANRARTRRWISPSAEERTVRLCFHSPARSAANAARLDVNRVEVALTKNENIQGKWNRRMRSTIAHSGI